MDAAATVNYCIATAEKGIIKNTAILSRGGVFVLKRKIFRAKKDQLSVSIFLRFRFSLEKELGLSVCRQPKTKAPIQVPE